MPLIPVLRRQRQVDLHEFKYSLDYTVSSRRARNSENPSLEKQKNKQNTAMA